MKTNNLAASVLALALGALPLAAAQAGEGNGNPFANNAGGVITFNRILNDTGSAGTPRLGRTIGQVTQGDIVPLQSNSAGIVQTANSLPPNAEAGTVATAQAESVQRWVLANEERVQARRLALAAR